MKKINPTVSLLSGVVALLLAGTASATNPIVSGFNANTLSANDDQSTGQVALGFNFNFFGTTYSDLYVNNNGNVTFNGALGTYTPFGLTSNIGTPIIAPFFGDVDTRAASSGLVNYGTGTYDGHAAFGVNWPGVGYYSYGTDKLDTFQLLLVDRPDLGSGDADIYFNYGSMQWETGGASGGSDGLGGSSAHVGYSNGSGNPGTNFELTGSGVPGSFIDGGPHALDVGTNDGVPGQYLFEVRNGAVIQPPTSNVPEPGSLMLFGAGVAAMATRLRKRKAA